MKKKRIYILIIILILIFIIFNIFRSKKNIFDDIMIFNLWNATGDKNEYVINPQKEEKIELNVFNTTDMYEKIAPGSSGQFKIKLIKPQNSDFKIVLKETSTKPQNLIFIVDGKKYYNIKDIEEKLNKIFRYTNNIIINWVWEYEVSEKKNIEDTEDGKEAQKYAFEITATIE